MNIFKSIVSAFVALFATISVFAAANVTTEAELKTAVAAGGEIALGADIAVTETIVVPSGVTATLDFNGKAITVPAATKHIYALKNYGTLTIADSSEPDVGKIVSRGIYNYSSLTMDGGTIDACDGDGGYAVNNEPNSTFVMNGGMLVASYEDDNKSEEGGYDATALDVPSGCTATLNGGVISNVCDFTFAISAAGTLNIPTTSTVIVKGRHGAISVSGGTTTIDAGTFEVIPNTENTDNVTYVLDGSLIINGGTFIGDSDTVAGGCCVYYDKEGTGIVTINGGNFSNSSGGDVWGKDGATTINGGIFENLVETNHVAVGATIVNGGKAYTKAEDGKLTENTSAVAVIGGKAYDSFADVLTAVKTTGGSEIVLLGDVSVSGQNALDALTGDTLNLNNFTLTVSGNSYFSDGVTTFKGGNIVLSGYASDSFFCGYTAGAEIVFDNVNITGSDYSTGCAAFNANLGKITAVNSTIELSGDTTGGVFYGGKVFVDKTTIVVTDVCRGFTNSDATIKNASTVKLSGTEGNSKFETGFNNSTVLIDASIVTISNAGKRAVRLHNNTLTIVNNSSLTATGCEADIVAYEENSMAKVVKSEDSTLNAVNNIVPKLAKIGDAYYTTLTEAVAALKVNGGTLKLLADVNESMTFNYPAEGAPTEIAVDLNGFAVTSAESTLWVSDGYVVTIKDSSDAKTGKIISTNTGGEAIAITRNGHVILESGYIYNDFCAVWLYNATENGSFVMNGGTLEVPNGGQTLSVGAGKATINGGKILCNKVPNGGGWNTLVYESGALEITGGEFFGTIGNYGTTAISGGTFSYPDDPNDGFNEDHLASGYATKVNADGSITVYELPTSLQGTGTAEDPFLINNIDDLKLFRSLVNSGTRYNGQYVKLTADIDLNDEEWTPIGDRNVDQGSFLGTFDGDNHTIVNLWISKWTKTGAGFFSKVGLQTEYVSGTVKNLIFNNVTIVSSESFVGVIAQAPSGALIENVHVTGDITISGYGYVGGIVGHGYPTINNSSVVGDTGSTITANYWGAGAILGFAGDYGAKISNATVEGVKIHANYGGAASVAGSPYGAALDGASVKNVEITSNSDYCMGYVSAGGNLSNVTIENVTATANGQPITPADAKASIGDTVYFSLSSAISSLKDGDTLTIYAGEISEGTIKFPASLKNVMIKGRTGAVLKDMTLMACDGSNIAYEGITFDGIVFDNSNILFSGQRASASFKDWTIANCEFKNVSRGNAAISFNLNASEAMENFTFTNNVIDGVTGGNYSGLVLRASKGNVVISGNDIKNVVWNAVQLINSTADTLTIEDNRFASGADEGILNLYGVTAATLTIKENQFLVAENQPGVCYIECADVSLNYWGGDAPANLPSGVTFSSYYTTVEDGVLGGLVELPKGTLTNCYTSATGYWGECGGNAKESFVFKFYNDDTYMGYTSLNNVGGIIDGDVNVSWNIKLDAASNTDEYWTMAWEVQPTLAMQPNRCEQWVDGVKVAECAVEPNWSDRIFPVVAAVTDEKGQILSYVNNHESATMANAVANGGYVTLLADVKIDASLDLPADKTLTLDLNGKKISAAGEVQLTNAGELTIRDSSAEKSATNELAIVNNGKLAISSGYFAGNISGEGEFAITGGTYTQDVKDYCAEGYQSVKQPGEDLWQVGKLPNAEVVNMGPTKITEYSIYNGSGLASGSTPIDLQVALEFIAKDTPEQASANAYGDYTTDFYIKINGAENGSFTANGCYLAGNYGTFGWIMIPLDGMVITNGVVYPVISSVGFDFKYVDICTSVKDFKCGIYFSPEVLEANPNLSVSLDLGLSETIEKAQKADFVPAIEEPFVYDVEDMTKAVAISGPDYFTTVKDAVAAALETGDSVKLVVSADLEDNLVINRDLVFNLGGNTLTANGKTLTIADSVVTITNGTLSSFTKDNITLTGNAILTVTDKDVADSFRLSDSYYVSQNANGTYSIMLKSAFRVFITVVGGEPRIGFFKDCADNPPTYTIKGATNLETSEWMDVGYAAADDTTAFSTLPLYWVKPVTPSAESGIRFFKLSAE